MADNEYLDFAKELDSNTPANDYTDAVRELDQEKKQSLQSTIYSVKDKNPDRQAEVLDLSNRINLPSDVVERNFDEIKKDYSVSGNDYEKLINENPGLSEYLSDSKNAGVSKDDIEALKNVEDVAKENSNWGFISGMFGAGKTFAQAPGAGYSAALLPSNIINKYVLENVDPETRVQIESFMKEAYPAMSYEKGMQARAPDWTLNNPVTKYLEDKQKEFAPIELGNDGIELAKQGKYAEAGKTFAVQAISNTPQMAAIILAGIYGGAAAGAAVAGASGAASGLEEARNQEGGVTPLQEQTRAIGYGAAEVVFEKLGTLSFVERMGTELSKKFGKEGAKATLNQFFKTVLWGAASEGSEEALTEVSNGLTAYATGDKNALKNLDNKTLNAFVLGGIMGSGPGAVGAGIEAHKQNVQIKKAKVAMDLYNKLGDAYNETKTGERSINVGKEFVTTVAKHNGMEKIYIPVEEFETYYQKKGISPAEAALNVGASEAYNTAKETGGDVEISYGEWVSKTSKTEDYKGLASAIKFAPEDISVTETQKLKEDVKAEAKAGAEQAKLEDAKVKETVTFFKEKIKESGVNKGVLSTKDAALMEGLARMVIREGGDPVEYFKDFKIDQGESIGQAVEKFDLSKLDLRDSGDVWSSYIKTQERADAIEGIITENAFAAQERINAAGGKDKASTRDLTILQDSSKSVERIREIKKNLPSGQKLNQENNNLTGNNQSSLGVINEPGQRVRIRQKENAGEIQPLKGNPESSPGTNARVYQAAEKYAEEKGIQAQEQINYVKADPERGSRIAIEFDKMVHTPNDPVVKEAYQSMISETIEQYQLIKQMGINIEVITADMDNPYPNGSADMIKDFNSGHLWVFPSSEGFGQGNQFSDNPLLNPSGEFIGDYQLDNNEIFRIVHDVFGHVKEGNGFGPNGEENAFQSHVRMYSPQAARAMTTETRGQNSWVNFGPYGEQNQSNKVNTKYADQKIGLLPEWVTTEAIDNSNTFKQGEAKGSIVFKETGVTISMLEKADKSTFIHELGHLYLETLKKLSLKETATQQTKDDLSKLLNWFGVESASDISTDQHEMFARGFEKYLAEGNAPTKELQGIFSRFKAFLLDVYKNLSNLNVELTDDVRDVMARMLAGDEATRNIQTTPMIRDVETSGMTAAQKERYLTTRADAEVDAQNKVTARLMKERDIKEGAEYKAREDVIRKEITDQINSTNVYRALSIMGKNQLPDGSPVPEGTPEVKLDPSSVNKDTKDLLPRNIFSKESALTPDIVAPVFGFKNGTEMIENLKAAPKKEDAIDKAVKERMDAEYPDLLNNGMLPEAALEEAHSDKSAELKRLELEYLAKNDLPALKGMIKRVAKRVPTVKEVRTQAEAIVTKMKVSELKPYIYERAERKAANRAAELFVKGDFDAAFEAKRQELLNHEIYRATVEAKNAVEKTTKKFKKMFKSNEDLSKSRDIDIVNATQAVLAMYGLAKPTEKTANEFLELMETYDPDTYNTVRVLIADAERGSGNYKDVSFEKFTDMKLAVESLWYLSKSNKEIEIEGQKVSRETVANELNEQIDLVDDSNLKDNVRRTISESEKFKQKILGFRAALTRAEHWAEAMDLKKGGPFTKYFIRPIMEATTKYRLKKAEMLKKFEETIKAYAKDNITSDPIDSPELGFEFKNKTELLMALLHTGNESNKSKLLRGWGWGVVDADGVLDSSRWDAFIKRMQDTRVLTKADYDFAQSVWDMLESIKPDAQKTHKKLYRPPQALLHYKIPQMI